jgi:tRNA threonylcarbamoyladenosine biosynthesis protein TsaE
MMNISIASIEEIPGAAEEILTYSGERRIIAFFGEMGVGKTTLIHSIVRELGVQESASSPTFSLVNEYLSESGDPVYHFDFYRIESIEEVYDMGYEEYFFSGHYCLIEWSEKIVELLPNDTVRVDMNRTDEVRQLILSILN